MRVVVISRGDFVHLSPFLNAMTAKGWEVHLAALSPWMFGSECDGVTSHNCFAANYRWLKPFSYAIGALKLRFVLDRIKPDMVWGHYVSSAGAVAWLAGAKEYNLTVHGSDVLDVMKRPIGRFVLRRVFAQARKIHTVSQQTADAVFSLGVEKSRVKAIAFGVEIQAIPFRPVDIRLPLRVICTRSLQYPIYDIPTLLKAVAALVVKDVPLRLTLGGRGKLQSELEAMAADLGISDYVEFRGGFTSSELVPLMQDHDVYVSASHSDGASLSLMEAMAAGLFPVLSDIPANRDWIMDERGLYFPVGSEHRLAEQLARIVAGEVDVASAVAANRRVVEEKGNRSDAMERVLSFLDS